MTSISLQLVGLTLVASLSRTQGADPSAIKECTEQGKCYWKGECKTPGRGRVWQSEEECAEMWCHAYKFQKYLAIRVSRFYGCRYKGQCKQKGEEWEEEGCVKKQCRIRGTRGYERIITVSQLGCRDSSGKCHFPGIPWEENCIKYQCVNKRNSTSVQGIYDVMDIGCPHEGGCLKAGQVIPDPQSKCITKRCVTAKENGGIFRTMETDDIKCEDANGLCHDESETGWPLYIDGTVYNNCHCKIVRTQDGSVSIQKGCS